MTMGCVREMINDMGCVREMINDNEMCKRNG